MMMMMIKALEGRIRSSKLKKLEWHQKIGLVFPGHFINNQNVPYGVMKLNPALHTVKLPGL